MAVFVRRATDADYSEFYRQDPPYCWLGYVAVDPDQIVGMAGVVWTDLGVAIAFMDRNANVSPVAMHRTALRVLAALEEVGEPVIFTRCDEHIPRAREWLQRLGFVEDGELWRKDFLWPH